MMEFMEKINRSSLSEESKNLLSLIAEFFNDSMKEKDERISKLESQVETLSARLQSMEKKQDVANQYSRLDCITISPKKDISGSFLSNTVPNYDSSEDTKSLVLDLFKDQLALNLNSGDISIAHRLKPPTRSPNASSQHDRRSIVVRLCRKDLVGTIFKHCKEMKPNFYVNESLTPMRHSICYALRTLKRKFPDTIAKVHTFKGVPRAFVQPRRTTRASTTDRSAQKHEISTILELETFTKNVLKTTLQEEGITIQNRV